MKPDEELCLCFHVTRRKVEQFVRARRPAVASQLSECYGAGTGCGWCRPFLRRIHAQVIADEGTAAGTCADELPDAERYAASRQAYRRKQAGGEEA